MTQFKKQTVAVLTSLSVVLMTIAPVSAATLEVSGNGSNSTSEIVLEREQNTTVVQSSTAVVNNSVSSSASTGGNKANDNTGGDVMIRTGDATSRTTIENTLNSNMARVDCCEESDVEVKISGNGTGSDNYVGIKSEGDATNIFQENNAVVNNSVKTDAKTGDNNAKRNTGGEVIIRTGDAEAKTNVSTTANNNQAVVGGGRDGGSLSAVISGNGYNSDNSIELELDRVTTIVQDNLAVVANELATYAGSGDNDTNDNTGGDTGIWTGDAKAHTYVDNMVNFNAADIDCGCILEDVHAKVSGNGTDSDNDITADLGGEQNVFQGGKEGAGNLATLLNGLETDAETGDNNAKYNTGEADSDPFIYTGDAYTVSDVSNAGNVNVFGSSWDAMMDWPEVEFDFSFNFAFAGLR